MCVWLVLVLSWLLLVLILLPGCLARTCTLLAACHLAMNVSPRACLQVLLFLGQDPTLAHAAGHYIHLFCPAIILHAFVLCIYRYLVAQGAVGFLVPRPCICRGRMACPCWAGPSQRDWMVHPWWHAFTHLHPSAGGMSYVLAAGATLFAITLPIHYFMVFTLNLGLDGSALASVMCESVYLAAMVAAAAVHNRHCAPEQRPWRGLSWAAFTGWGEFVRRAMHSALFLVLDWWLYDATTLLAGMLPEAELPVAATGILYSIQVRGLLCCCHLHGHWYCHPRPCQNGMLGFCSCPSPCRVTAS